MYSGITGQEFAADIYLGVVYYQRLRHMVNDKFQVRTTGPVHQLTRQPIKGRKRAGGIRFGEMERDALLAHGTSFLLQDRLMNCSDYSTSFVCRTCGSIISLGYDDAALAGVQTIDAHTLGTAAPAQLGPNGEYCRICRAEDEARKAEGKEPLEGRRLARGGQVVKLGPENLIQRGSGGLDVIVSCAARRGAFVELLTDATSHTGRPVRTQVPRRRASLHGHAHLLSDSIRPASLPSLDLFMSILSQSTRSMPPPKLK